AAPVHLLFFSLFLLRPPVPTLFPYTTLFRSAARRFIAIELASESTRRNPASAAARLPGHRPDRCCTPTGAPPGRLSSVLRHTTWPDHRGVRPPRPGKSTSAGRT